VNLIARLGGHATGPHEAGQAIRQSLDESFATYNAVDAGQVHAGHYYSTSQKVRASVLRQVGNSHQAIYKLDNSGIPGRPLNEYGPAKTKPTLIENHRYFKSKRPVTRDETRLGKPGVPISLANLDQGGRSSQLKGMGGRGCSTAAKGRGSQGTAVDRENMHQGGGSARRRQTAGPANRFRAGEGHDSPAGKQVGAELFSYNGNASNQNNSAAAFQSFRQYATQGAVEGASRGCGPGQSIGLPYSSAKLSTNRRIQEAFGDPENKGSGSQEYYTGRKNRNVLLNQKN